MQQQVPLKCQVIKVKDPPKRTVLTRIKDKHGVGTFEPKEIQSGPMFDVYHTRGHVTRVTEKELNRMHLVVGDNYVIEDEDGNERLDLVQLAERTTRPTNRALQAAVSASVAEE